MISKFSVFSSPYVIDKVKEIAFFKQYANDDKVIKKIIEICEPRVVLEGSYLIKEGERGDELFIILSGTIDIVKKTLQDEEYIVATLSANNESIYVGELALIDQEKRSATVVAKTKCECITLRRNRFLEFGDEFPEIGLQITRAIASQLSQKLRKTSYDVITLFSALVEEISSEENL